MQPQVLETTPKEQIAIAIVENEITMLEAQMYVDDVSQSVKDAVADATVSETASLKINRKKFKELEAEAFAPDVSPKQFGKFRKEGTSLLTDITQLAEARKVKVKQVKDNNAEAIAVAKAVKGKISKLHDTKVQMLADYQGQPLVARVPSFNVK